MTRNVLLLTIVALCAVAVERAAVAVPITWLDSQWTVGFPSVAIGGDEDDTNYRRAFGRTINNGATTDLTGGDAWLKVSAHADDDADAGVSISASLNASRSVVLTGAPYGWGVTVKSSLRGQLWNDDLFHPLERGTISSVAGSATITRKGSDVALGGTTHSVTNKTHEQTTNVPGDAPGEGSKSAVVVLNDGEYTLKTSLTSSAEIQLGCGLPGTCAEANSLFFTSPAEALGGIVSDATRWGLHVSNLEAQKLGHITIKGVHISPARTAAPLFTPLPMHLFLDLTNDGGSTVTVDHLDFSLLELDELSPSDLLKKFSIPELLVLTAGETERLTYPFVMSASAINLGIDDPRSDRNHLDFGVDGSVSFTDFASRRSVTFSVPEPATAFLFGVGLAGIIVLRRGQSRRRPEMPEGHGRAVAHSSS